MSNSSCKECNEIYQGLLALVESSHTTKPGPNASAQQLAEWFDERDENDARRMPERAALLALKSRLIEHKKLTGHLVPMPLPPYGQINPN